MLNMCKKIKNLFLVAYSKVYMSQKGEIMLMFITKLY